MLRITRRRFGSNKGSGNVGGCRKGFSRTPSPRHDPQQHSNGEKEEQDSEFPLFCFADLLIAASRSSDHGAGTANASLRTRKVRDALTHPTQFVEELTISSINAAPKG